MRAAFVSGGSSGIGFATAHALAVKGHNLALFARDAARLLEARAAILADAPDIQVETYAVDVANRDDFVAALTDAMAKLAPPEIAVASAGMATPGLFIEQSYELHARHMAVNYLGALTLTDILSGPMAAAGGGKIGLIASGAAFFGIYGYSAYAPSKFALRGLSEILHLELAPKNISVTLIYPPDTDTPQLAEELRTKPLATQKITAGGGRAQPSEIARKLIHGMQAGHPVVTPGLQMTLLYRFGSLLAPLLRLYQKHIIARHGAS
ncbi:SDR family NAD(P)-dependent oxidoreductase [Shimia marina]|uniref:Fatty acyl-CoA reductase n=1 Tax=Shimia marina TaxID=321267 RepID=A0A0P1ELZ9_9RHOB|nr:SDR family NAD(P)-dependent oxidoreductase [Shimia marina]CUH51253.1 Fatty acyl-CoA reductase [Shimia marina]SFD53889.1 3-dehydrosphinganine reductase [Shimia marina]